VDCPGRGHDSPSPLSWASIVEGSPTPSVARETRALAYGRTLPILAQYWADGERTVLEIADLVEMETRQRDVELLVEHFRLLAKMGLVKLD